MGDVEDHLNSLGASFLYLEEPTTVMHVGSVLVLDPGPSGFDEQRFLELVEARTSGASRYRQKVREMPARIAAPFWVDAADFDLTYHVRRSALPRPGTQEQLEEFVARIFSRPLDRAHPLWELYIVEGLEGGRVALVTKTHQALVDGVVAVDIAHLLLDDDPDERPDPVPERVPGREPSNLDLLASTALDIAARPSRWAGLLLGGMAELAGATSRVLGQTRSFASAVARTATDPAPPSPLNAKVGASRRVSFVAMPLASFRAVRLDYRRLREARECTVTDVILTVITGALRTWLQTRGSRCTVRLECVRWCLSALPSATEAWGWGRAYEPVSWTYPSASPTRQCAWSRSPSRCVGRSAAVGRWVRVHWPGLPVSRQPLFITSGPNWATRRPGASSIW